MQVLAGLHEALQAVDLNDPLLRVTVGLRLALHLEGRNSLGSAAGVLKQVRRLVSCPATVAAGQTDVPNTLAQVPMWV